VRLEVTQRADLAVRALVVLARTPARLKSGQLSSALGTTPGFVSQIMAPLVQAGWVRSDPGPTGGYQLVARADRLSVLAVVEAVDGPTDNGRCVVSDQPCLHRQPCALHRAWVRAREELTGTLHALTVAEVGAW
jgi:Rrf2 family protein